MRKEGEGNRQTLQVHLPIPYSSPRFRYLTPAFNTYTHHAILHMGLAQLTIWLPSFLSLVIAASQASDLSLLAPNPLLFQKPSHTFSELLLPVMFADFNLEGDVLTDG